MPRGVARQRAQALIAAWDERGAELMFVENADGTAVHVVAPVVDEPGEFDPVAATLGVVYAVCGVRVRRHRGGMEEGGRLTGHFRDDLLCGRCHRAFGDRGDLIFECNPREGWRRAVPTEEDDLVDFGVEAWHDAGDVLLDDRVRHAVRALRDEIREPYDDLLASIALYIGWRHVTKQLTTPQKDLFADALERHGNRVHGPDGEDPDPELAGLPSYAPRWWRDE